jgi:glucose-6-phosphate-specific signal transduction histidine kinase
LTIRVQVDDDVAIEVTDNGIGIGDGVTASGLTNLRRRAEDCGGTFQHRQPGDGRHRVELDGTTALIVSSAADHPESPPRRTGHGAAWTATDRR